MQLQATNQKSDGSAFYFSSAFIHLPALTSRLMPTTLPPAGGGIEIPDWDGMNLHKLTETGQISDETLAVRGHRAQIVATWVKTEKAKIC